MSFTSYETLVQIYCVKLSIFFYTTTWLPPLGCQASPSQGVATGQKLVKSHKE